MMLVGLNVQRLAKANFLQKLSFWGKSPKISSTYIFLTFAKKLICWVSFALKIVHKSVVYESEKTTCLGKCGFSVMT